MRTLTSLPLKQKLPLLVCGLLAGVTVLNTVASYGEIRSSASAVGRERLRAVSGQLAEMLGASVDNTVRALRAASGDTTVIAFLRSPTPARRAALVAVISRSGGISSSRLATELLDANGALLASSERGAERPRGDAGPELARARAMPSRPVIGHFRVAGDTVMVPLVAAVSAPGVAPAFLVVWTRLASTPAARAQVLQLIGSGTSLLVGNDTGTVWTDLASPVPPPPGDPRSAADIATYERPGVGTVLARGRPIAGTPWFVVVEIPEQAMLAGADQFLWRSILIGALILLVGFVLAWAFTRGIAGSVDRLSRASVAAAAGDLRVVVPVERRDELGTLAEAFNTMMERVRSTQEALEDRVRERTQTLQERNAELEAFAYSVSHDLRTPLRAMHGFSAALLEDHSAQLDAQGHDYVMRIGEAATRMDALVRDLLAYSQVSRAELVLEPVNLETIVWEANRAVEPDVGNKGAVVQIEGELPPVIAHRATLLQVVANLIGNALKFVAPGTPPRVRIVAEPRDQIVRLWVEDNGVGIPPEHQELVFHVFERLHHRDEYPGTGIGLAIVRKGVERMHGAAGVVSSVGRGSRFWVDLPAAGTAS